MSSRPSIPDAPPGRSMRSRAFDRREFLLLSTLAAASAAVPSGVAEALAGGGDPKSPWAGYDKAVVVDALGSPGGSGTGEGDAGLSAAEIADVRASGVTAVN